MRTPTALRATAPRSPSRSRSTDEAPSATAEWAVKPSTAAMKTVILSARSMPASPTASTSAVTALSAASPAASRAVGDVDLAPHHALDDQLAVPARGHARCPGQPPVHHGGHVARPAGGTAVTERLRHRGPPRPSAGPRHRPGPRARGRPTRRGRCHRRPSRPTSRTSCPWATSPASTSRAEPALALQRLRGAERVRVAAGVHRGPRRRHRLLRIEAAVDEVREHLHVPLHLTVAAGRVADVPQPAGVVGGDPGVEGVQRLAPRGERVGMSGDQVGAAARAGC